MIATMEQSTTAGADLGIDQAFVGIAGDLMADPNFSRNVQGIEMAHSLGRAAIDGAVGFDGPFSDSQRDLFGSLMNHGAAMDLTFETLGADRLEQAIAKDAWKKNVLYGAMSYEDVMARNAAGAQQQHWHEEELFRTHLFATGKIKGVEEESPKAEKAA